MPTSNRKLPTIGWREWVALPDFGIPAMKAKVDTGARSSALHAFDLEIVRRRGHEIVRFKVHPRQRSAEPTVHAEAEVVDHRYVRTSSGHRSLRPVIQTTIRYRDATWPIEVTLVGRDEMGFRMLLGRQAVRRRFVIDPGRSFLGGRRRKRPEEKGRRQ